MQLSANAAAKLNFCLGVTGRTDNGYHLIESVMQSVGLFDTVTVKTNHSGKITVKTNVDLLNNQNNTAYLSAEKYFSAFGISDGVDICIEKRIPSAAGLGGGSADAAAVLTLLDKIYGKCSVKQLEKIALSVGADVPFCLSGGTAAVRGIGEKIEKLPDFPDCFLVLVKNGKKSSTKDMYNAVDKLGFSGVGCTEKVENSIINSNLKLICQNLFNDFYKVCKTADSENILKVLKENGAIGTGLSGAGPTLFGIFENMSNAEKAREQLILSANYVFVVKPTKQSFFIID